MSGNLSKSSVTIRLPLSTSSLSRSANSSLIVFRAATYCGYVIVPASFCFSILALARLSFSAGLRGSPDGEGLVFALLRAVRPTLKPFSRSALVRKPAAAFLMVSRKAPLVPTFMSPGGMLSRKTVALSSCDADT